MHSRTRLAFVGLAKKFSVALHKKYRRYCHFVIESGGSDESKEGAAVVARSCILRINEIIAFAIYFSAAKRNVCRIHFLFTSTEP